MNAVDRPKRKLTNGVSISRLTVEATDEHWAGRRVWKLTAPFSFDVLDLNRSGEFNLSIYVKSGFLTDYASIPRVFWWIWPHDECAEAAIVHDWIYQQTNVDRQLADSIFRIIMRVTKKPYLMRLALYLGVRIGGWAARKPRKESDQ